METNQLYHHDLIVRTAEIMAVVEALAELEKENQLLREQLTLAEVKLAMRDKAYQLDIADRMSLN